MNKIACINCGGIGDILLGFQCGHYVEKVGDTVNYFLPVRDEIFRVIKYLFPDKNITQIHESYDAGNNFEKDIFYRDRFDFEYDRNFEFEKVYWIVPDLLFNNDHAFDYKKYNVSPSTICSTRLLAHLRKPTEKVIYCALNSSTGKYQLGNKIREILISLANYNSTYQIFFNTITRWAGESIDNGDLTNLPSNVNIVFDLDFIESLEILRQSQYVVSVDCGIYHISKHIGLDTLLLDTRISYEGLPWLVRWREFGLADSISVDTESSLIGALVNLNLTIPSTTLTNKHIILSELDVDWGQRLFLKKY